jgi:hypothetical protein
MSASDRRSDLSTLVVAVVVLSSSTQAVSAQQVLDRILARVNGQAITLSDARAAIGLGVVKVPAGEDPVATATDQLIVRQLLLGEVARFSPPEPDAVAIAREKSSITGSVVGTDLDALMKSTGLDDEQITEIARDNLRVQAYLNQRFGTATQATQDEAADYYRSHPEEFQRNGKPIPFDEAEPTARQRSSSERRQSMIGQWLRDLRQRADVVVLYKK